MNSRTVGIGAIVVTALLWGTTGTAATFASTVGPLAIGAVSLGLGGILQAVIAVPCMPSRYRICGEDKRSSRTR